MPQNPQIQTNENQVEDTIQNKKGVIVLAGKGNRGYPIGKNMFIGYIINLKDMAKSPIKEDIERQIREQILLKESFGEFE